MPQKTVLVVDDSSTIRVRISRILDTAGYRVIQATDGQQALDMLSQRPDLMILDVVMPGMDGYDVCQNLDQQEQDYSNLPILFLTSLDNQALRLLGHQYGAYMQKPIEEAKFLTTIEELIQLAENEQMA